MSRNYNNPTPFSHRWIKARLSQEGNRFYELSAMFNGKGRILNHSTTDYYGNYRGVTQSDICFLGNQAIVRLWYTDILHIHQNGAVLLDNGGYATNTVKRYAQLFGGLSIWTKDYQWYLAGLPVHRLAIKTPNGLIFTDAEKPTLGQTRYTAIGRDGVKRIWREVDENQATHSWRVDEWLRYLESVGLIRPIPQFENQLD